jgi:hypothetical protein
MELPMKKNTLNAIVDALLVITMVAVAFMGVLLGFFVGRGNVPQAQKYLWGLHRHDWGDVHLIFSLILVGLVILHFILHIGWARQTSKRLLGLHWAVSLLILLVITAGVLWLSIVWKRSHLGDWEHEGPGPGLGRGRGLRLEEDRGFRRGQGRGGARGTETGPGFRRESGQNESESQLSEPEGETGFGPGEGRGRGWRGGLQRETDL